jgi:hypothetical protein
VGRIRRLSTRHLIAWIVGLVAAAVVVGTTIALAAAGGPSPPPRALDRAIHHSLAGRSVPGVSARIHFTNHLIDTSGIEGVDPILKGASGRLWATADGRVRLELQADDGGRGDAIATIGRRSFSLYDPSSNTIYRGTLPQGHAKRRREAAGVPSLARIDRALKKLSAHARLSGAKPGDVGGKAAYGVTAAPRRRGGLLGALELAWDASRPVPLKAAVYAKGDSSPVLELEATHISYTRVPSSDLVAPNPPGAKVVRLAGGGEAHRAPARRHLALNFQLSAPAKLAGRARSGVKLIGSKGHPAALVTYGRGLGGIAVIETRAGRASVSARPRGDRHEGRDLTLPTVLVNGVKAQLVETPLGTAVRFRRGGVSYAVLGSVPRAAAVAAARGL